MTFFTFKSKLQERLFLNWEAFWYALIAFFIGWHGIVLMLFLVYWYFVDFRLSLLFSSMINAWKFAFIEDNNWRIILLASFFYTIHSPLFIKKYSNRLKYEYVNLSLKEQIENGVILFVAHILTIIVFFIIWIVIVP